MTPRQKIGCSGPLRLCENLFFKEMEWLRQMRLSREFLKKSAALGLGAIVGRSIYRDAFAASNGPNHHLSHLRRRLH